MTRLGIIVPSTNTVAETDFQTNAPAGFSVHTARMYLEETNAASERRMVTDHLPGAARDLATMQPDVVVFACTSAGAVLGAERESELVDDLSRTTKAPVVSTNASVHRALTEVAPTRLAVVTAYVDELTGKICAGLESAGLSIVHAAGMGILDPFAIAEVSPDEIVEFVQREVAQTDFDALFVSCTNLAAFAARGALQAEFGVPVVTSNQAALAAALDVVARPATRPPSTSKWAESSDPAR